MGKIIIAILFVCALVPGVAAIQVPQSSLSEPKTELNGEDEVFAIDQLVQSTAHQLEVQKEMRELMLDFRKQKDAFAKGDQSKAHAAHMVRTARLIYESITAHHLQHLFSQEYIEELVFFSSIAGKNRIKNG